MCQASSGYCVLFGVPGRRYIDEAEELRGGHWDSGAGALTLRGGSAELGLVQSGAQAASEHLAGE